MHTAISIPTILKKLGIAQLNPMQEEAMLAIPAGKDVMLLSPTGTGKTLAFLLPIISQLDPKKQAVQALVIAPARELAIQIEQVARSMGSGHKINVFYGGRPFAKDNEEIQHPPSLLVGTPGRIADHLRRGTFDTAHLEFLMLDEFDKSLEIGFEKEMKELISLLPQLKQTILTSATEGVQIPYFIPAQKPVRIDYLNVEISNLRIRRIVSPEKDKLHTLVDALRHLGNQKGIVFCNYKDSIQRISDFLQDNEIPHGCFYGGLDQRERERALIKFRNGTHRLLLATDLAARGIDVDEINFIIHYHLPFGEEEFTHRNGRTARMHKEGTAFVLHWQEDELPDYIPDVDAIELVHHKSLPPTQWQTVFVSGGRKDKVSKGDIAGFFHKEGKLKKEELGLIELKRDCAFVAIAADRAQAVIKKLNNQKIKKRKVRVKLI